MDKEAIKKMSAKELKMQTKQVYSFNDLRKRWEYIMNTKTEFPKIPPLLFLVQDVCKENKIDKSYDEICDLFLKPIRTQEAWELKSTIMAKLFYKTIMVMGEN